MAPPLRFYLESSFWLRLVDRADPDRRRATRWFLEWMRPRHFGLVSDLVHAELRAGRDSDQRRPILRKYLSARVRPVPTTQRVRTVAWDLVGMGCVTANHLADAFHLAYSVVGRVDAIVTWDVQDIAREHTRRLLRDYCWRRGLPELRVGTPIEVAKWLDVKIRR